MHKRHPVLFGLLLLSLIGIMFFFLVYGISSVQGEKNGIHLERPDRCGPREGVIIDPSPSSTSWKNSAKTTASRRWFFALTRRAAAWGPPRRSTRRFSGCGQRKPSWPPWGPWRPRAAITWPVGPRKSLPIRGRSRAALGVIMHFTNVEDLFKKVGLRSSVIKSGKYKGCRVPLSRHDEGGAGSSPGPHR